MNLNEKAMEAGARALNGAGWISFECYHEPGEYDRCEKCKDCCDNVAGRIITAYLEAMVVNTREELDALPVGTVIQDFNDDFMRITELGFEYNGSRKGVIEFRMDEPESLTWVITPARVIYTPEVQE